MDYGSILWDLTLEYISFMNSTWENQNNVFWNIKLFLWELICIKHFITIQDLLSINIGYSVGIFYIIMELNVFLIALLLLNSG